VHVRVQKWGNSQGLRLSKDVLELAGIGVGDELELTVQDQQILLRKVRKPKYDLATLFEQSLSDYRPTEMEWGPPVGREEW